MKTLSLWLAPLLSIVLFSSNAFADEMIVEPKCLPSKVVKYVIGTLDALPVVSAAVSAGLAVNPKLRDRYFEIVDYGQYKILKVLKVDFN